MNSNKIVKLHAYLETKDYAVLILEYMNNKDLNCFIKKFHSKYSDTNFSEVLTAFFINQILKALEDLNIYNILHRCINPENIMLNTSYDAKLKDFSFSSIVDMTTPFQTFGIVNLEYIPPECVNRTIGIKPYLCERLDLFSLGVVMYFLLFNRHPFGFKVIKKIK